MHPTKEMMAPVRAVAGFMATGETAGLEQAFAGAGIVVIETFAPFLFKGPRAFAHWRDGFRAHAARGGLSALTWRFGEAQDFACDGGRVFFVLPTTWSGLAHGRPFTEDGGWAFVLDGDGDGGRWRIRSYAWAVTSGPAGA